MTELQSLTTVGIAVAGMVARGFGLAAWSVARSLPEPPAELTPAADDDADLPWGHDVGEPVGAAR